MEAYRLSNNSPQTSLKQRVQVDDIKVIDIGFEHIVNCMTKEFTMPVLYGAPTEYKVCTEWDAVEELEPISSCIGQQCIQMEANIPTDWDIDAFLQEPKTIHLIEIHSVASDVKLVGYGNRNIEYIGTTVVDVTHLTQTKKATFYVTKLNDDKVILGLWLCIDLQLHSVPHNSKF